MIALIDEKREALERICREHRVARLELFGSATTDEFDPQRSDLDFLVEFQPIPAGQQFNTYFDLKRDLEALFGRSVDLVQPEVMTNPYFIRRVNESRIDVYAA